MPVFRKQSGLPVCLIVVMSTCFAACNGPRVPARPTGGIRLAADPPSARVYVNEKLSGTASIFVERPLLLKPGAYRIKLVAEGYYPGYVDVEVADEVVPVEVKLTEIPEPLGVELK